MVTPRCHSVPGSKSGSRPARDACNRPPAARPENPIIILPAALFPREESVKTMSASLRRVVLQLSLDYMLIMITKVQRGFNSTITEVKEAIV